MRSNETINRGNSFNPEINPRRSFTTNNNISRLLDGLGGFFAPSRTGGQKPDEGPTSSDDITQHVTDQLNDANQISPDRPINDRSLVERWRKLPIRIVNFEGGIYPDGTIYQPGTKLLMGEKGSEQEVMNSFEEHWCQQTAKKLLEGKTGPQIIVEGGFGLGIMSEYLFQEMLSRGGEYHIIELNEAIYKRLEKWAAEKQKLVDRMGLKSPLKIIPHFGDAYEVLQSNKTDGNRLFMPGTINGIVLDLHQLEEADRGIENLKGIELVNKLLEDADGRLAICAFHKYNQNGDLDPRQRARISPYFEYRVIPVRVTPPIDCEYFQWPNNILPVVICKKSHLQAA